MVTDTTHKATIVRAEPQEMQRMHPLVGAAMAQGSIDPATLRDLLAVQREWEAGEARKAYTRALAALKRDLPTVIERDAVVDFTNRSGQRTFYRHATLAGVMDAITDPLTAHGFALGWTPAVDGHSIKVTCRLTHTEGHTEEATLAAPADTSGSKSPAQAIASTVTLLSRYTALALLGIATRDMPEPSGEGERATTTDEESGRVDADRNFKALRAIGKAGRTRAEAEALVGRPLPRWTVGDLAEIREWLERPSPTGEPVRSEPARETVVEHEPRHALPPPADTRSVRDLALEETRTDEELAEWLHARKRHHGNDVFRGRALDHASKIGVSDRDVKAWLGMLDPAPDPDEQGGESDGDPAEGEVAS